GRIINLSSSVVGLYQPGYAAYAAAKAGIEAMTHVLTKELRGRSIHRQRHCPRADRDRAVPRRQAPANDRQPEQARPAGTVGPAGRYRESGRLPRGAGW